MPLQFKLLLLATLMFLCPAQDEGQRLILLFSRLQGSTMYTVLSYCKEEMGEMEEMDWLERRGSQVWWAHLDIWGRRGYRDHLEYLVPGGQQGRRASEEIGGRRECGETRGGVDLKGHRVRQLVEQSTFAGAGPPAPLTREPSCCITGQLGVLAPVTKVEELISYVCQVTQTTSNTRVEFKAKIM